MPPLPHAFFCYQKLVAVALGAVPKKRQQSFLALRTGLWRDVDLDQIRV